MAKSGKDAQASFRLPQSLYDQLKVAAGDRPIGDEMRRRLEASFLAGDDAKTNELVLTIARIADDLAETYGRRWHEDQWARDALLEAVAVLVKAKAPRGEPKYDPKPEHLADLIWVDDADRVPSVAGRMLAMMKLTGSARGEL